MALRRANPAILLFQLLSIDTAQALATRHMRNLRQDSDDDDHIVIPRQDDDDDDDDDDVPAPAPAPAPSSTATATAAPSTTSSATAVARPGLDAGAKAGIAIGVILGVFFIGGLLWRYWRRRMRRRGSRLQRENTNPPQGLLPPTPHQPEVTQHNQSYPTVRPNGHQVDYKHTGGGVQNSHPSPMSSTNGGRPWSEAMTVSTPSTEVEAGTAHTFDGFQYVPQPGMELPIPEHDRVAEAPVFENTIWEAPDTDRSGHPPVELPASSSGGQQFRPPTELATDKGLENDRPGGYGRTTQV